MSLSLSVTLLLTLTDNFQYRSESVDTEDYNIPR
jgi:hypothetical protein